jgi:predicted glycosyltransferase involved in capsule biosynthesis
MTQKYLFSEKEINNVIFENGKFASWQEMTKFCEKMFAGTYLHIADNDPLYKLSEVC